MHPNNEVMYSFMVKFFKTEEHLKMFQSGWLFCNTFEYFRNIENDDGTRNDPLEGLVQQTKVPSGEFWLKPKDEPNKPWQKLSIFNAIFSQFYQGNIFCLSRFKLISNPDIQEFYINDRFNEFGDYYALILNQIEFENKLKSAIKKEKLNVAGNMVEYLNPSNLNQKRSAFMKDNKFEWQCEYRYHFQTSLNDPLQLNIGDLKDITMSGMLSKNRKFEYKFPFLMPI